MLTKSDLEAIEDLVRRVVRDEVENAVIAMDGDVGALSGICNQVDERIKNERRVASTP